MRGEPPKQGRLLKDSLYSRCERYLRCSQETKPTSRGNVVVKLDLFICPLELIGMVTDREIKVFEPLRDCIPHQLV